jgi:hypothetical protein
MVQDVENKTQGEVDDKTHIKQSHKQNAANHIEIGSGDVLAIRCSVMPR